jgi:hypothetical protein
MNTSSNFRTPEDFLKHLKSTLATLLPNPHPDPGWQNALEERYAGLPDHSKRALDPMTAGDTLIRSLAADIIQHLQDDVQTRIKSFVAIGGLLSGELNASIIRSPDKKFAILVNSGLIILLNKVLKLETARRYPRAITYCNRKSPSDLTDEDLIGFREELVNTYRTTGVPRGAMVIISQDFAPSYMNALTTAERFVICHELAHYLNGDLADDRVFVPFLGLAWASAYVEGSSHLVEYAADATAFSLMRQCTGPDSDRLIFHSAAILFDVLHHIRSAQSSTHPGPHDRTRRLAETFFPPTVARQLLTPPYGN